jgi:hypothetical protein
MTDTHPMRQLIDLVESAGRASDIYWFNPRTGDVHPCRDHGEAVEENPNAFGIPQARQDDIAAEYGGEDSDLYAVQRNEAWEQLGLEAGWVRVGYHMDPRLDLECAYVSSASAEGAWMAIRHMEKTGSIAPAVDVSLVDTDMGFKIYARLAGRDLTAFVRGGPSKAHDQIDAVSRRALGQTRVQK